MREIKFRAYQPHTSLHRQPGMYLVDDLVWYEKDAEGHTGEAFLTRKLGTARSSEYLEDIKLMQYTGLRDKNGVEIYEGDIITWGIHTGAVEFKDGYFVFNGMGIGMPSHNGEVIGNIYENPDLLKTAA